MPTPCPGRCNSAWRRAEELGYAHTLQPVPGEPVHCWACYSTASNQLAQLPGLFVAIHLEGLHGTLAKLTGTIGRVGLQAPPWPGQHARLFADGLADAMLLLANDTREQMDEPVQNPSTDLASVQNSIATFAKHLRWLLGTGVGPDADRHPCAEESHGGKSGNPGWQIGAWHRSAEVFCKQDEQRTEKRLAACPRCRDPWMQSRNGAVECTNPDCRKVMSNDEYAVHVELLVGAAKFAGIAA